MLGFLFHIQGLLFCSISDKKLLLLQKNIQLYIFTSFCGGSLINGGGWKKVFLFKGVLINGNGW